MIVGNGVGISGSNVGIGMGVGFNEQTADAWARRWR
jgi:hypothetical protein